MSLSQNGPPPGSESSSAQAIPRRPVVGSQRDFARQIRRRPVPPTQQGSSREQEGSPGSESQTNPVSGQMCDLSGLSIRWLTDGPFK